MNEKPELQYPEEFYFQRSCHPADLPEEGKRRLLLLAAFLAEKLDHDLFDFSTVINCVLIVRQLTDERLRDRGSTSIASDVMRDHINFGYPCGALGCAIGWSYSLFSPITFFDKQGCYDDHIVRIIRPDGILSECLDPSAYARVGSNYFGIDINLSSRLFSPLSEHEIIRNGICPVFNDSASPELVAYRIRHFVETGRVLIGLPSVAAVRIERAAKLYRAQQKSGV